MAGGGVHDLVTEDGGESTRPGAAPVATDDELARVMPSSEVGDLAETKDLLGHIGLVPERPVVPPVFGQILEGEATNLYDVVRRLRPRWTKAACC